EAARVENPLEAREAWMQSEGDTRGIRSHLQHVGGRDGEVRPPAVIKRIVVRNQGAQRVVTAAHVEDHEIADVRALRLREAAQELRRSEGDGEGSGAALDELTSGDLHGP